MKKLEYHSYHMTYNAYVIFHTRRLHLCSSLVTIQAALSVCVRLLTQDTSFVRIYIAFEKDHSSLSALRREVLGRYFVGLDFPKQPATSSHRKFIFIWNITH